MRYIKLMAILVSAALIIKSGFALDIGNRINMPADKMGISYNGKFLGNPYNPDAQIWSENGEFWCRFAIGQPGDEVRQLNDFSLYRFDSRLFTLNRAPGSDLYISNSGYIAFLDHTYHFGGELTINFYSCAGEFIFAKAFESADQFGFSPAGNMFGVRDASGLHIISIADQKVQTYPNGRQFCISPDGKFIAIADENAIRIYADGRLDFLIDTDIAYPGGLDISPDNALLAAIGKKELKVYSLPDGTLRFSDSLADKISYRDIEIIGDRIFAGVHYRDDEYSRGIIRAYDLQGSVISNEIKTEKYIKSPVPASLPDNPAATYEQIPWPLAPQDSVHTVWNHYEQHMSYGQADWSYLHQGLDLITEIEEPVYAVDDGVVKCVLTLGGESYWRTAISPEQSPGWSNGWLYAHLIQSSIQFEVGDSVHVGDYLGNIIEWTPDWGHIHFAEIRDTGLVWDYFDNQWGITHNPLLSLTPNTDSVAPVIEDVFSWSKFAFCLNETGEYLNPDSLHGDVDIIVKISDFIGDSPWEQPAFETYYWLVSLADGDTVIAPTLGQILNHQYDVFGVDDLVPYATLLYKRDNILLPPRWTTEERDYYQLLTNNNGDSLVDLSEHELAWHTSNCEDGRYRLFVKALDAYGHSTIDSQEVRIRNQVVAIDNYPETRPRPLALYPNNPNPFNSATRITFVLPEAALISLRIYDILGREIRTLADDFREAGQHSVIFKADGLPSGIYLCQLNAGGTIQIKKMAYIR